eukprot:PITA_11123
MTFNEMRLEYALEGNSNFITWKDHMEAVLDDDKLLECVKIKITKQGSVDAQNLDQWKKDVSKARRIILRGVQDHIVSNLHRKETLFTTFTQVQDELGRVGVDIVDDDLVSLALLGLPKSWNNYQDSVNGKKISIWECLWPDLVQKEIKQNTRDGTSSKGEDEENFSLVRKGRKGKEKKSQTKLESNQGVKKKDLSKIKFLNCYEFRHYSTKCRHKRSSKKNSGGAAGEDLASYFELEFTLISYMANTMMGSVWYLDLGALFHMTGCRYFLTEVEEKYLHMDIELRDNERYIATRIGTITFNRESRSPLHLKYVMFVPGLKKNFIIVVVLEDHG